MNEKTILAGIMGLVVGDALGVPVEFESRTNLNHSPVSGMRSGGAHGQPKGTWSDDSSMALCLMESLSHGLDYQDQMSRYLRWADEGYMTPHGGVFDMGITTRKALQKFLHGTPPSDCGGSSVNDNGNGSLMRILPLAMYLYSVVGPDFPDSPESYVIIQNTSGLTHAHPISQIACAFYCAIACELISGHFVPGDIQPAIDKVRKYYSTTEYRCWLDKFKRIDVEVMSALTEENVSSNGYMLSTLEAALWCLLTTNSFSDCVLKAVNLGEDTDTVGAVAGGLAGLKYGYEDIPLDWLNTIVKREYIECLCRDFAASLEVC